MNQFAIETVADWIGFLLIMACVLWLGWECLVSYCDRQPIYDPMTAGMEDQAKIAAEHCAKMGISEILGDMGLRHPLPEVRKTERQEWPIDPSNIDHLLRTAGCSQDERDDILKGTKL